MPDAAEELGRGLTVGWPGAGVHEEQGGFFSKTSSASSLVGDVWMKGTFSGRFFGQPAAARQVRRRLDQPRQARTPVAFGLGCQSTVTTPASIQILRRAREQERPGASTRRGAPRLLVTDLEAHRRRKTSATHTERLYRQVGEVEGGCQSGGS